MREIDVNKNNANGGEVHWDLLGKREFERKEKWYDHFPERVLENMKDMKRLRGERREETGEINQKHWRENHHCLYLENHVF